MLKTLIKFSAISNATIRGIFSESKFGITKLYNHRDNYTYLDKTESTDEWQKEVYEFARNFMIKNKYRNIVDFGCGSGYKMMENFKDFDATGVEVKETYEFLINKYPEFRWLNAESLSTYDLNCDLVICADVIEHVLNPDDFIEAINKINFKHLIISTPERILLHGNFHFGPPKNPYHIREWSAREFRSYLSSFYKVELQQITNVSQATQMIVCSKK